MATAAAATATSHWTELFGDELVTADGPVATRTLLADAEVVGVYFSAHWCPPCRVLTPELSTAYEELREAHGTRVELVFVSSDHEKAQFDAYFAEMPFAALPFEQRARKQALSERFRVPCVPTLVFLDAHGDVVTRDGEAVVRNAAGDMAELWTYLTT
ncbi:hypothetical protein PybrP1_010287 [[Pythium] brassicae (nom. inval.)]|nr:hypothetical protein PybrP1_010287 [[Pythium] brassicae (nom. inval.)]